MFADNKIWMAKSDKKLYILPNMSNRHGVITGASGTGKTISLKVMAEAFSDMGVPVFLADIKGDLAGMCAPGVDSENMQKRIARFGITDWRYTSFPTRYWDIYGEYGLPVRTTVSEMGPLLLSRLMQLSDIQSDVLSIIFRIADDRGLLLIDIKDLRAMLRFVGDRRDEYQTEYGNMSTATVGSIQRALLVLEDQGGDIFFGEPAIDIFDWIKTDAKGRGYINVLHSVKLVQNPTLYATFMLYLMSELFEKMPEVGDLDKPRIAFFFDEAHFLFTDAPKILLQKIEQVVRLIRSKGVGIYFISQSPGDIPDTVLAQLSHRVQHALRAYTPMEQKAVRVAAQTFRPNPAFSTEAAITELGVGEALVSFLDDGGRPGIVERAFILPPQSQMGTIADAVRREILDSCELKEKYRQHIDRDSAYEALARETKLEEAEKLREQAAELRAKQELEAQKAASARRKTRSPAEKALSRAASSAMNTIGREVGRSIIRGLFGSRR